MRKPQRHRTHKQLHSVGLEEPLKYQMDVDLNQAMFQEHQQNHDGNLETTLDEVLKTEISEPDSFFISTT